MIALALRVRAEREGYNASQENVRFLDPLSVLAVRRATGRSAVGGLGSSGRPLRGMTIVSGSMNEIPPPPSPPPLAGDGWGGVRLAEQQLRARRSRSIAFALALGAFVVVIFLVTLVKLGGNVLTRPM